EWVQGSSDRKQKQKVETIVDPGVTDKRVLWIEEELSSTFKVLTREGNTLSPRLREAWDGHTLRIRTKNSPCTATDPHVAVIGHITKTELLRHLRETEAANGFGNRFLWFAVRLSKELPEGGKLRDDQLAAVRDRLKKAIAFAGKQGAIQRNPEATAIWH